MYISFEEYNALYDGMEEKVFNRLSFDAGRIMDIHTTGVDGVKKLKVAFPTEDAEIVRRCAAKLIHFLGEVEQAESGYESTEQGLRGRVISSVTAGNESISYAVNTSAAASAAADKAVKDALVTNIIREYLSGATDANGVNLLYMGAYPRRYLC